MDTTIPENLERNLGINNITITNTIETNIIKTKKLSALKWSLIEKPLSESDKQRNKIICDLGEKVSSTFVSKSNLITVGEYNYLKIREQITKYIK